MGGENRISDIAIRRAIEGDAYNISNLINTVHNGKYPNEEFTDPQKLKEKIGSGEFVTAVAEHEGIIVGTTTFQKEMHLRAEISGGVILKNYQNQGIGTDLCFNLLNPLPDDINILWGSQRNGSVYNIGLKIGMQLLGYNPGTHALSSRQKRETHLISAKLFDEAKNKRIFPRGYENFKVYQLPFVREIIQNLHVQSGSGEYPDNIDSDCFKYNKVIRFNYSPNEKTITLSPLELGLLASSEYTDVVILADKTELIDHLMGKGFQLCAFLPAWVGKEQRYDCVKLAKPHVPTVIVESGFIDKVELIKKQCAEVFGYVH